MSDEPQLPLDDAPAAGRLSMSVVQVELTGAHRCAHASHLADADDDEIADEWVRCLLAAAELRGPHLTAALREAMTRAGTEGEPTRG